MALFLRIPSQLLSNEPAFAVGQVLQLAACSGLFMILLIPLDYLGGYLLPKQHGKLGDTFFAWLARYVPAALGQAGMFVLFGTTTILLSQKWGLIGGVVAIAIGVVGCLFFRNLWVTSREVNSQKTAATLVDAMTLIQTWNIYVPYTVVARHRDIGFTGGIIGFGQRTKIVIPESWLEFPTEQLASAIARRAVAIESGSYSRGVVFAFFWNVVGFLLCSLLPNASLTTVAGLVTTVCGFTTWSFLGLLILPTFSRNASLKIDRHLKHQGMVSDLIAQTAHQLDELQDGEPKRSALIEAIFHPIPNVASRNQDHPINGFAAWNVARTTLFFSWPCLNFLSRSVHCNVGRPELWAMLPTD